MMFSPLVARLEGFLFGPVGLLILFALAVTLSQRLRGPLIRLLTFLPATILWAFSFVAFVLWRPAAAVVDRRFSGWPARLARGLEALGGRGRDLLCRGEREAAARAYWREEEFPFLYRPVPHDILRPLHEDGKLIGGVSMTWLADRHMTEAAVISAMRAGLIIGCMILVPPAIQFLVLLVNTTQTLFSDFWIARPVLEQWPGLAAIHAPWAWWGSAAASNLGAIAMSFLLGTAKIAGSWSLFAIGGAIMAAFTALKVWQQEKALPYTLITKDADVRWGSRVEIRNLANAVYRKQIELSEGFLKGTAVFKLGVATGIARLRGDLTAPLKNQEVCLDGDSLFQHLLVLGGTGEGKTTAILKPLMRRLMAEPSRGFFVCDAKGVLARDALNIAISVGRENTVSVIGTGEGQFGVDPLANLSPTQIAATLRSVSRQVAGAASDSFWPDMGNNVIRHVLQLAVTYRLTDAGRKEEAGGLNPYSLWWTYQTILNAERLANVIGQIRALGEANDADIAELIAEGDRHPEKRDALGIEIERLGRMISAETIASISYFETTWSTMASETKTGIIANVTQLLDGFAGAPVLRERFACGRSDGNTISISQALEGRIVLVALSSIEDGLAATLVEILLKTTLYREARVREATYKAMTPPKNPQEAPCTVIMDEVQEIVTADPDSGLSDATFWNVARSAGLNGIFATQTLAALYQALGTEAANNFIQQARSKIFLRTEDRSTVDYACWCAGQAERNRVYEDGQRESIDHRQALDGWDPFAPVDATEAVRGGRELFLSAAKYIREPTSAALGQIQRRNVYEEDLRFVNMLPRAEHDDKAALVTRIQMQQGAAWRAEDLERQYRAQGNEMRPLLTSSDILGMGRWHAFVHIQRAGAMRQDIIEIEHDHA